MSNGDKGIATGSSVFIKRDDGSDRTLLRSRPTNSRSDDAFVTPKVTISGDDRLVLLQTATAEGTAFSFVRTSAGAEGYVQSKYIVLAPSTSADVSSPPAASGAHAQFRPCKHQNQCGRDTCKVPVAALLETANL
jgi:hypothetical protein